MKRLVLLLIVSFITLPILSQSRAERRAEKKAKIEAQFIETKALIESQEFVFEANWAIPLGNDVANIGMNIPGGGAIFQGGRVDVSSNYNMIDINGNDAEVFLPYFGRVFFQNAIQMKMEYSSKVKWKPTLSKLMKRKSPFQLFGQQIRKEIF